PFGWFPVMPPEPLAARAQTFWQEAAAKANPATDAFGTDPAFVSGGNAGAFVANIYPGRPSWLERGSQALSPWISDELIATRAFLSIGRRPEALMRKYDLCVVHEVSYSWANVRGEPAREVILSALAPREACVDAD
ncbi:MAG: hypothetical protein AAF940_13225, partial [Pseudomonadota bacterium]